MKKLVRIFVVLVLCYTNLQVVMANATGEGIGKLHPRLNRVSNLFATPDAPTNLVATGINTGGIIQFTAPASDGGSAITNYEYSTDNGATWITPSPAITTSPLIISSGLINCTSYQVKIRAVNANDGSGTASAAVSLVPSTSIIGVNWTSRTSAANNSWTSVTYGNGRFVAVASDGTDRVMTSPDGINWTASTSAAAAAAANKSWQSVTYGIVNGNGLFVAVSNTAGTSNQVMTSPDGINWTADTSAADIGWKSVTYGNGLFVAVSNTQGTSNRVMTSSDGITWTTQIPANNHNWTSVTYGKNLFVAVAAFGTGNRVMTSENGILWTSRTSAADNGWRSVTYGNGVFVAVASTGTGNRVMTSENGILWTSRTSAADLTWNSITYANGMFVAVASTGTGNRVMTSPDGITWTARTSAADNNWSGITYANGMSVAVASIGSSNRVMTSTFNVVANPPVINTVEIRNGGIARVFFTASSSQYTPPTTNYEYSTDNGLTFTALSPASIQSPINIGGLTIGSTYAVRIRAINSLGASCVSSSMSVTIVETVPGIPTNLVATGINTGGMIQFAHPNEGGSPITNYQYSLDNGQSWVTPSPAITASPLIISSGLTNCTSYQVKLRAVNSAGSGTASAAVQLIPATSVDMVVNWTQRASAANNNWSSIAYGNELFVAVAASGSGNRVMTSPDGITWTARTSAADLSWNSVTYGNGLFVAVASSGAGNRVMTSPDGITWTARNSAVDNGWIRVTYGNGLFVAVAASAIGIGSRVMTSPDGINWTARNAAAGISWQGVTYGNGLFVAVGNGGANNRVMTSSDGITWTIRTSASDAHWTSVAYGNGLFVAVAQTGTGNRVMTSPDGITWTARTSAADNNWASVTYGNGLFVAVAFDGAGNRVMTSPDGIVWTSRTSAADLSWNSITYANGMFVAVASTGSNNRVMTSTFNVVANPPVISSVDSRNGGAKVFFTATSSLYAAPITNYEYSTDDGVTFTALNPSSNQSPITIGGLTNGSTYAIRIRAVNSVGSSCTSSGVSFTPSVGLVPDAPTNLIVTPINTGGMIQFIAPVNDGGSSIINYEYSTDNGITWITPSPANASSPLIISSGLTNCTSYQVKIRAVNAVGSGTASAAVQLIPATSVDIGVNWTQRTSAADRTWTSVTYGNGVFVAVASDGAGNRVMTSPDGITWTARTSAADHNWTSVTYGNGLFVAVANTGTGNRVMTSPDGINWTSRTSAADNDWSSIAYGNGLFVAVANSGTNNRVMTSPDGINWTSRTSASDAHWTSVAYGNGLFVAIAFFGNSGTIMTSPDGITWTIESTNIGLNARMSSLTYGKGLFVVVENGLGVLTSANGITFNSRRSAANNYWRSVTFGNGLFVAVANSGAGNRVMTSPDGITWTSRTSAADNNWSSVTYGNGVFVAVASSGSGNRVMTSSYSSVADAPVITSSSYSSGTAIVNFTQSASSFAPTITNYEYSTDNGSNWVAVSPEATTSPLTITGLATVPTTILIRAVNSVGNSCPSNNICVPPTSPTASAQTFVGNKTVADLVATGTDLKWYDVATNGTALASTTAIATGTYYVSQTLNSCESDRTSVSVTVAPPSAPGTSSNLIATGLNSGGMIQFTAPTSDGGSPITNYEYSIDNGSTWITPSPAITSSPLIISSGLTNCTSYQVKIRAVNANGSGTASAAITLVPSTSNIGVNWTQRTSAADNFWRSITYGNGLFVSVATSGAGNRVMTSPDGITWTARTSAADNSWNSVTYGNGLFVAVAYSGAGNRVMTSSDGITWTIRTSAADNSWSSVTYGSGLFVAVAFSGAGNRVMTSPDGITWTSRTSAVDNGWNSVTYGNGLFVAVANSGAGNRVMTSPDGITWTARTSAVDNGWNSVTYGNGRFVAVASTGTNNRVMTSVDGITWNARNAATENNWTSVTYGNGLFVAVAISGTGNRVMTSVDGETWTSRTSAANSFWFGVTYGNGVFVAVAGAGAGRVMTSSYDVVADAPVITSATLGTTSTVSFTQTASALAPAITNYLYSIDNGSNWTTLSPASTTSPIMVTGLTDFKNQIQLQAINSVGNSCPAIYLIAGINLNKSGQKSSIPAQFVNKNGAIGISGIRATGESRINTPILSATAAVTNITATTATSGGTVGADGGASVTARGVCWSTTTNPTIANSKTTDGTGIGTFTSAITGLTSGTTYYVRSYATNSVGTTYGPEVIFTTL